MRPVSLLVSQPKTCDAYYFFNPFGDYWLGADYPLEVVADVTGTRWADDIAAAEDLLRSLPAGTWILTYTGFGRSRTCEL
jgi:hypothetical protein